MTKHKLTKSKFYMCFYKILIKGGDKTKKKVERFKYYLRTVSWDILKYIA